MTDQQKDLMAELGDRAAARDEKLTPAQLKVAFDLGKSAAERGKKSNFNPYVTGSEQAQEWQRGWEAGRR